MLIAILHFSIFDNWRNLEFQNQPPHSSDFHKDLIYTSSFVSFEVMKSGGYLVTQDA